MGGEERKKWARMGLRGLPAFVQQVKWPDSEKPAEKLILVQRDAALIQASGRKEAGFAFRPPMQQFTSLPPDNIKTYYGCAVHTHTYTNSERKTKHIHAQWINMHSKNFPINIHKRQGTKTQSSRVYYIVNITLNIAN